MITEPTLVWHKEFLQHQHWNNIRFKKLQLGYPKFNFPKELIDEVDVTEFLLVEKERIPIFISTQFGIYPNPKEIFNGIEKSILVAKLDKSLLSGHVSGLSICNYSEGHFHEIELFKN